MSKAIEIGNRRELFVDDYLIEKLNGDIDFELHHPTPKELAFYADQPSEGALSGFITVLKDGDLFRMYYKGFYFDLDKISNTKEENNELKLDSPLYVNYAESKDGIHWTKPNLGLFECNGSKDNNIVWIGTGNNQAGTHGFSPFIDLNPDCKPAERFKAVGAARYATKDKVLYAMTSPDGIHWKMLYDTPIVEGLHFDSQNLAFWDTKIQQYRAYMREFLPSYKRTIMTATSPDFIHWTEPEFLEFPGVEPCELYTNQISNYYRAPHIYVGFPTRYTQRKWSPAIEALTERETRQRRSLISERCGSALTDGLFMSSRDGKTFKRWNEAFIKPGLRSKGNWAYGDNYQCWGLIETPSEIDPSIPELSFFATEGFWRKEQIAFRRFTIRLDGFVSLTSPFNGGEIITKPITFTGDKLSLNMSTSAAGSIRIEITDLNGNPIDGLSYNDCHEVIGDSLDYTVQWQDNDALEKVAGQPVKLKFKLQDASIYSFQFC